MIELLVAIAIIVILLGAVITVGHSVMERGKERETAALLQKLSLAADEYARAKPLGKMRGYITRYGNYPPDELDAFSSAANAAAGHISPGQGELVVGGSGAAASRNDIAGVENPDIKAFVLAVRLYSEQGTAVLDDVASRYRRNAKTEADGKVSEFLDRNGNTTFDPGVDDPLDYLVDAWGMPLAYFSARCTCQRANVGGLASGWDSGPPRTPAAGERIFTSTRLLELNNSVPLFVSYGPDGPDQFSEDYRSSLRPDVASGEAKDLVWDFSAPDDAFDQQDRFDNRFNQDNIYSTEELREKIAAYAP